MPRLAIRRPTIRLRPLANAVVALLCCLALPAMAADGKKKDRHVGYYYPELTSAETYVARAKVLPRASRNMRIGFVVAQTLGQRELGYPPRFAMFAKGDEAQKLIIVGLHEGSFGTLYRARGVLAQMTAAARSTELFRDLKVEDYFTFFDLVRMLGFERLTITDGRTYAHQVTVE